MNLLIDASHYRKPKTQLFCAVDVPTSTIEQNIIISY